MTVPVAAEPVAPGLAHEPERTHDAAQERRSTAGRFDLQAKLRVNPPGDRYEQEADRVADAVVAERPVAPAGPLTVSPLIQRQAGDEEDEERKDEVEEVQARRAAAAGDADVGADLGRTPARDSRCSRPRAPCSSHGSAGDSTASASTTAPGPLTWPTASGRSPSPAGVTSTSAPDATIRGRGPGCTCSRTR